MNFESSSRLTIGTVLLRVKDNGGDVTIYFGSSWCTGKVKTVDEFGVLLVNRKELTVIRVDQIIAIQVPSGASDD